MAKKKLQWIVFARYANLAFSFGVTLVAAILLGLYVGGWVDRRLGTFPVFMLLGIFLGVGLGFYNLWSELTGMTERRPGKKSEQENDEQHCGQK